MRKHTTFIRQLGQIVPIGGYGILYNGWAFNDAKFCPNANWNVPSSAQYTTLYTYLGGISQAGSHLKADENIHWNSPNTTYADNSSGLSLYGCGGRAVDGTFIGIKDNGNYGCTGNGAPVLGIPMGSRIWADYNSIILGYSFGGTSYRLGVGIRLIWVGGGAAPSTVTDYDGNVYDTILIGTQYYTKQNWKCTKLNDGTSIPEETGDAAWAALSTGAWCYYNNDSGNL